MGKGVNFIWLSGRHFFLQVQLIGSPVLKGLEDFLSQLGSGLAHFLESAPSNVLDYFSNLLTSQKIDFFQRSPAAQEQVPDGYGEAAGQGGYDEFDFAFAGQEFFAPAG